jgi:hypothetical protein
VQGFDARGDVGARRELGHEFLDLALGAVDLGSGQKTHRRFERA